MSDSVYNQEGNLLGYLIKLSVNSLFQRFYTDSNY